MDALSTALSAIDVSVISSGFFTVLPMVISVAGPIVAAKVALHFLFSMVKGA